MHDDSETTKTNSLQSHNNNPRWYRKGFKNNGRKTLAAEAIGIEDKMRETGDAGVDICSATGCRKRPE